MVAKSALQKKLDVAKWLDSEARGTDLCGEYEYCAYCDPEDEFPCAAAYLAMQEKSKSVQAAPARKAPVSAQKEAAAVKEPTTDFKTRLVRSGSDVRYFERIEALLKASGLTRSETKTGIGYSLKRVPLVKIVALKKGFALELALDPSDKKYESIPHETVTAKTCKTPFRFPVTSELAIDRAKALIDDVLAAHV